MNASRAREIAIESSSWKRSLDYINNKILKAAEKGEFSTRSSCYVKDTGDIFDVLKSKGFTVKNVLDETDRCVFEISW